MPGAPFVAVHQAPRWGETRVPAGGRLFLVSELSGQASQLGALFDAVTFNTASDLLICVGSLCGPHQESQVLVDLLNESWFMSVRGPADHDIVQHAGCDDETFRNWASDAHPWLLNMKRDDRWGMHARLNAMPDGIRVEHQGSRIGVVHSGWPRHVDWGARHGRANRETLMLGRAGAPIPRDLDYLVVSRAGKYVQGLVRLHTQERAPPAIEMLEIHPRLGEAARWRFGSAHFSADRIPCLPSVPEPSIPSQR